MIIFLYLLIVLVRAIAYLFLLTAVGLGLLLGLGARLIASFLRTEPRRERMPKKPRKRPQSFYSNRR